MNQQVQTIEADSKALRDEIRGLQKEVNDLEDKVVELQEQSIVSEHICELARCRTLLKTGNCEAGREKLERVLDELDSAWRTLS